MKVLLHYEAGPALQAQVAGLAARGLDVTVCAQADEDGFNAALPDVEAIWHVLKPITPAHIARAGRLRLIQKIGVGVNTIALEAARAAGVAVCNMPGANTRAVAEMTLLHMLAALRRQPRLDALVRSGAWTPDAATRDSFGEIGGRVVGFVGFGAAPQMLAPVLEAMGAQVVYWARTDKSSIYPRLQLDELLALADIVSIHVPLTEDTRAMIGERQLRTMKRGAVLVNTARGGIVDEHALLDALTSSRLTAAGLDVFAEEPAPAANPLFALDQVVVTPHTAWLTQESWTRSLAIAVENALALRRGERLRHQVI